MHPNLNSQSKRQDRRYSPDPFVPRRGFRAATTQTILARYRPAGLESVVKSEQPLVLEAGADATGYDNTHSVRLHGYYNTTSDRSICRGLVLLLHGWEGCSHATYNLIMAKSLLSAGFDVFRLNLRDHGPGLTIDPYALNRGFFLGTLIDEVATAAYQIAAMAGERSFYVVGPSLGGNFALRLAVRHQDKPFHSLCRVIAVNPVVNPYRTARRVDAHPLYRRYFRKNWLSSMHAKQKVFPDLVDVTALSKHTSIYRMTDWFVRTYTTYTSAAEYFSAYGVSNHMLKKLAVPTVIISARDDSIIPVADFYAFAPHPLLDIRIHPYGGHVGFVEAPPIRHMLPNMILAVLGEINSESIRAHDSG